jgi:hypothetical protein
MKASSIVAALVLTLIIPVCCAQADGQEHAVRWLSHESRETVLAKLSKVIKLEGPRKQDEYRIEYLRSVAPPDSKDKTTLQYIYRIKESDKKFELTVKARRVDTDDGTLSMQSASDPINSLQAKKLISKEPKQPKIETDVTWTAPDSLIRTRSVSREVKLSELELKAAMAELAIKRAPCSAVVTRVRVETNAGRMLTIEAWKLAGSASTMYEVSEKGTEEAQISKRFAILVKQISDLGYRLEAISKTQYASNCKT